MILTNHTTLIENDSRLISCDLPDNKHEIFPGDLDPKTLTPSDRIESTWHVKEALREIVEIIVENNPNKEVDIIADVELVVSLESL